MKDFSALYKQAASCKGCEKIIEGMIPRPRSAAALVRIPDDRWFSGMAKAVFRAGFNWSVIVDLAAEHGTAAKYFGNYPSADYVGLLGDLKKRAAYLGGTTGQYFLRELGKDSFILFKDVIAALSRENVFDGSPTSMSSLADIQDAINEWVDDGGESLTRVSRVLAFTVG